MRKTARKFMLRQVINTIHHADDYELSQIIQAIVQRYGCCHPDWDVLFLSLPKDPAERKEQLTYMLESLSAEQLL